MVLGTKVNSKKDRHALLIIMNAVSESFPLQLDFKKIVRENWEILPILNVGVD